MEDQHSQVDPTADVEDRDYEAALKNPGGTASRKHWKQAQANVKTHDMPPEEADRQPPTSTS